MQYMKRHRAQAVSTSSRFEASDSKTELRSRLRFMNKKPLCLQYNLSASQRTKKVMAKMKRRNCEPTIADTIFRSFIPYLISLLYVVIDVHYRIVEFLLRPVEDMDPSLSSPPSPLSLTNSPQALPPYSGATISRTGSSSNLSTVSSSSSTGGHSPRSRITRQASTSSNNSRSGTSQRTTSRTARKKSFTKRDFGRNARLAAQQSRLSEFYLFP
uniref:Uncharacterized protein n=1 Tax=Panagrellus redivivus TaxID=6233 RepID=A0A7E4UN80_PANRE